MISSSLKNKLLLLISFSFGVADESWKIYDDSEIAIINISMSADGLEWMYENPWSDSMHVASIEFQNAYINETIDSVAFRVRGNTSRNSEKKSFKVDFNHFFGGRDFYNVEKLNLNGEHNDPSIVRSKLCWDIFQKVGIVSSRASHAKLYINGSYYGLYISIEHIDDSFVAKNYANGSGNLWKCVWPADLTYRGNSPLDYHPYHNEERPYELKTNKDEYNYSKLARLIRVINQNPDSLDLVLDTKEALQYFAMNVILGGWDDYRFLRNNFYLYHDPSDDLIHWIPYDYDNTLSVDWFNIDWSTVDPYDYPVIDSDGRPLTEYLFSKSRYRDIYSHFVQFYISNVIDLDTIEQKLDYYVDYLYSSAYDDTYRTLDYDFTIDDFSDSYGDNFSVAHVKQGILEFFQNRKSTLQEQLDFSHDLPIIYDTEINRETASVGDTITFSSALIANHSETMFNLFFRLQGSNAWSTSILDYNPDVSSMRIEDHDRWTTKIIPPHEGDYDWYLQVYGAEGIDRYPVYGFNTFKIIDSANQHVIINELLAKNETINADEAGEYDDWIELYNHSNSTVDLAGYYLTDKIFNLSKWKFPDVGSIIAPQSYMIIWCDEDQEQGTLHSNFKLSSNGEFIALVMPDGQTILDSVSFPQQNTDVSFGRVWQNDWDYLTPSPNDVNISLSSFEEPIVSESFNLIEMYPNPFNDNFNVLVNLGESVDYLDVSVISLSGQMVQSIKYYPRALGLNEIQIKLNNGNATGYYFVKIKHLDQIVVNKVLYLK